MRRCTRVLQGLYDEDTQEGDDRDRYRKDPVGVSHLLNVMVSHT